MSYFVGVENAKTSEKLPYFNAGKYTLRVDLIKVFDTRSKGPMFVSEYTVLESEGETANEVGSRVAHLIKLRGNDSALGNVKGLVGALTGEGAAKVNQNMCDRIVAADNPAKGTKLKAFAYVTQTREGKDFTMIQYSPSEEATFTATKPGKAAANSVTVAKSA